MEQFDIIKFIDQDFELDVNVSPREQTVWLSQEQIAILFQKSRSTITEHINNIFDEGELETMTSVGISDRSNHRPAKLYNLDVVLAVGYRVKSKRGILFRRWANTILREYLIKGYSVSTSRVLVTNDNYINLIHEVNNLKKDITSIKEIIKSNTFDSYVCYEGSYYDSFSFINKLICSAKERIIIIDGYADSNTLDYFMHVKKDLKKVVVCHKPSRISEESIIRFKKQYGSLTIKENKTFHDRFIIIDNNLFSIGTSLNSIGNKTSVISKIDNVEINSIYKDE